MLQNTVCVALEELELDELLLELDVELLELVLDDEELLELEELLLEGELLVVGWLGPLPPPPPPPPQPAKNNPKATNEAVRNIMMIGSEFIRDYYLKVKMTTS